MLAGDEVGNVLHRAGPVEGVHGDQVLEAVGLQVAQVLFHAGGLELEQAGRVAAGENLVGRRVVERNAVYVHIDAVHRLDVLHGVLDDRQRAQSQKVHLDQADAFDLLALELHHVQLGILGNGHRRELFEVVLTDDHAAGMHARLADRAFQLLGVFERIADQLVGRLALGGQLRRLLVDEIERRLAVFLVGRDLVGHQLRKAVALREGQLLHAGDVLDSHLGGHRAERHDLGHALLTVLLHAVAQHVGAAVLVEVHIDIGEGDAFGIEETLEQQVVFQRVDIGDLQTVGDHRTGGRATAGSHRHTHFACGADIVPHDQEVTRKSHPLDRAQLVFDALLGLFVQHVAVTHVCALVGQVLEVTVLFGDHQPVRKLLVAGNQLLQLRNGGAGADLRQHLFVLDLLDERLAQFAEGDREILRRREVGHQRGVRQLVILALVGDFERRGQRFGMVREERRHLFGRLEILLKRIAHTVRIVQIAARIETDQMVVRHSILGEDEVHVVRTDILDAVFGRQLQNHLIDAQLVFVDVRVLLRIARRVQLQFEVIVFAEDVLEPLDHALSLLDIVVHDSLRHFAAQARRAADQPLVVLFDQLLVDTRLVIESLGKRVGDHLAEVVIAFEVLGQQDQVVAGLLVLVLLETVFHHVDLAAQNRLDPGVRGGVVKVLDAVHVAVVGNGDGVHAEGLGPLDERLDGGGAVEDRILGMYVQMDEIGHGSNSCFYGRTKIGIFPQISWQGYCILSTKCLTLNIQPIPRNYARRNHGCISGIQHRHRSRDSQIDARQRRHLVDDPQRIYVGHLSHRHHARTGRRPRGGR